MTISNTLKKRFVKDTKIPIVIFEEPLFSYYLEVFNDAFQAKEKYQIFLDYVNSLGSEESFFQHFQKLNDDIINAVKDTKAFQDFNTIDMKAFKNTLPNSQKLYHPDSVGKSFVSIDLVKANFQALKFIHSDIVKGCDSYTEFLSTFTDEEYVHKSKQIRQVVFGNLNPKRQQTIQKYLMSQLKDYLIANGVNEDRVNSSTADELVISVEDFNDSVIKLMENKTVLENIDFHIEPFILEKAHTEKPFYLKRFEDGTFELKGVPSYYMPQVLKHVEGKEIEERDLYFYHEGELARFMKSLYQT